MMPIRLLAACSALALLPLGATASAAAPTTKVEQPAPAPAPKVDPAQAMAKMLVLFDRFFPAGPEPEPQRLALARSATMAMFPKGTYASGMNGFAEGMVERVLDMSEADFLALDPSPKPLKKGEKPKVPSTLPLRAELAKKDPMFDAKVAAGKAFAKTMFEKFGDVAEPRFREGMARSLARKFDAGQLAEIQAFLATPTGAAYGRQMVGMWFDPAVMRGSIEAIPDMMALLPDMAKQGETLEKMMKDTGKPAATTK